MLGIRIERAEVMPEGTLRVTFVVGWYATGAEAPGWSEQHEQVFAGGVTRDQVLSELQQLAEARAGAVAAVVALQEDVGRTFERQTDGRWRARATKAGRA